MQLTVLVEPIAGNGFRAQVGGPLTLAAEGMTEDDALGRLRQLIQDRLARGARLTEMQVPISPHPLTRWAGTWKPDDPFIEEWKRAIEEYRQQVEDDPDR